ncbi:MAG: hypothetical protein JXR97_01245, partial [Planctomycetes bacterium]|nr:hypothetical protein [Planctomycetota bacterium]
SDNEIDSMKPMAPEDLMPASLKDALDENQDKLEDEAPDDLINQSIAADRKSSAKVDTVELLEAGLKAEGMGADTVEKFLGDELVKGADLGKMLSEEMSPPDILGDESELLSDIPLDAFGNIRDPERKGALDSFLDSFDAADEGVSESSVAAVVQEEAKDNKIGLGTRLVGIAGVTGLVCYKTIDKALDFKKNWGLYCDIAAALIATISAAVITAALMYE